uniref:Uncharacterized protein n=1 Tax=Anopheles merus TaxID=30066 RepID=A0A182V552_ANOME
MAEQNQHNQVSNRAQHHPVRTIGRTVSTGSGASAAGAGGAAAAAASAMTILAESSTTPTDLPQAPHEHQQPHQHHHQQQQQQQQAHHEQLRVSDHELLEPEPDELLPGAHYGPGATMLVGMMPPLLPPGTSPAPLRPTNARLAMAYRNQNNFMTNSHQQQCGGYLPLQTRAW